MSQKINKISLNKEVVSKLDETAAAAPGTTTVFVPTSTLITCFLPYNPVVDYTKSLLYDTWCEGPGVPSRNTYQCVESENTYMCPVETVNTYGCVETNNTYMCVETNKTYNCIKTWNTYQCEKTVDGFTCEVTENTYKCVETRNTYKC